MKIDILYLYHDIFLSTHMLWYYKKCKGTVNVSFQYNIFISCDMFIINQRLVIICADSTAWCLFPIWLYLSSRPARASRCTRIGNYYIVDVLYLFIKVTGFQPVVTTTFLEIFRVNMWEILDIYSPEPCVCWGTSLWGILQATLIFCQSYEE